MGKDTIYRQDAINALHTEIVKRRISEDVNDDGSLDEFDTEDILRKLPSADVQPVRCKDCVYWSSKETRYCNMLKGTFQENDYCSYAERRTDE